MADHAAPRPTRALASAQPDAPACPENTQDQSAGAILDGARLDHRLADDVAARTESPREAEIDAANGLRSPGGRRPVPEDFADVLSPEGDSGDAFGTAIEDEDFVFGEDGSTGGTQP